MRTRKPAPEKVEVRMTGELRARLVEVALRESRSTNQQAVHYIKQGLSADEGLQASLGRIEAKLDELIALLGRTKP